MNIALIGASGNVGRKMLEIVHAHSLIPFENLHLFASAQSHGMHIKPCWTVRSIEEINFSDYGVCVFNTDDAVSARYIPLALNAGCTVIDSSSYYRLDPHVPLVVAPVNAHLIQAERFLYAHSNCIVSPLAIVLNTIRETIPIRHVNVVTFQSASGAGKKAMESCWHETQSHLAGHAGDTVFPRSLAFNVIPHIGGLDSQGFSSEEKKIKQELHKILECDLSISVTCVRVPVMIGHSVALHVESSEPIVDEKIQEKLNSSAHIVLDQTYTTPREVVDSDLVHVGRVRYDGPYHFHCWTVSDNLRRGAATDTIEILTRVISYKNSLAP